MQARFLNLCKQSKKRMDQLANQILLLGGRVRTAEEIYRQAARSSDKVCHIIGSGWSLNHSLERIDREGSYVMGFNYAAFAEIDFDLYFLELASKRPGLEEEARCLREVFEEAVKPWTEDIYFKNVWQRPEDLKTAVDWYGRELYFSKDYALPYFPGLDFNLAIAYLLTYDQVYLKQMFSTAVTCLEIAYFAGFKDIVLHGVDCTGAHFFKHRDFKNKRKTPVPSLGYENFREEDIEKRVMPYAQGEVSLPGVLKAAGAYLQNKGVRLMCAHEVSPLSSLLPVYEKS